MTKPSLIVIAVLTAFASAAGAAGTPSHGSMGSMGKKTSGRATLKGVDYYYEVRGQGEPLLMLHGGLGNSDMFEPLLPLFAGRQVITVDLQGHGRSSLGNRPIRCDAIADDVAALLKRLLDADLIERIPP